MVLLLALVATMVVIGCSAAPKPSPDFTEEEVIVLAEAGASAVGVPDSIALTLPLELCLVSIAPMVRYGRHRQGLLLGTDLIGTIAPNGLELAT